MSFVKNGTMVCVLALLILSHIAFAQQTSKMTIAILDFNNTGGLSKQETITLGNRLRSMLVKTNAFIVLERGQMDQILTEQGFQQTGCTTTECAVEMGALLNVEKMIAGSIGKLGKTYTIDLSLIDVQTARIEKSFFRDFKGEIDGLLNLMEAIANQIAAIAGSTLPKEQEIAQQAGLNITSDPEGAKIFINDNEIGRTPYRATIKKGQKLNVRIEKENFQKWEKTFIADSDIEIDAELEYTDAYQKAMAEEGGISTWVWIGGGAVLVGGAAVLLMSGSSDDNGTTEPAGFPAPPGRP